MTKKEDHIGTESRITHNGMPVKIDPTKEIPLTGRYKVNNPALDRVDKHLKGFKKIHN